MATKAEQIYDEINQMVEGGTTKADAFKQMAEEQSRPVDSIRGAYYGHKRKIEGGDNAPRSRTRRRETTAADALADARSSLERSITSIDKEVEVAEERAKEAVAEAKSLKDSAAERKKAITERLESLK
ncbi:MAG: hypothetical protein ACM3VU_00315 [Arthrospira platensis]